MDVVFLVGRIMFAIIFIGSGIGHLTDRSSRTFSRDQGNSLPPVISQVCGLALAACGFGIALGIWIDLALLGAAVLVLLIAIWVHRFWAEGGSVQQVEMAMFMKNLSIAGGALAIFALVRDQGVVAYGLTDLLLK